MTGDATEIHLGDGVVVTEEDGTQIVLFPPGLDIGAEYVEISRRDGDLCLTPLRGLPGLQDQQA